MLHIIPVLDVQNGVVVRGIGGRRNSYRPIVSRLTTTTDPLQVALAFRHHFGLNRLYLADLDALGGGPPALALYTALQEAGFALLIDAGVRTIRNALPLAQVGADTIIAALETLAGPFVLSDLCAEFGAARILFSLDLKSGQPLTAGTTWPERQPLTIAEHAIRCGIGRVLVLDLARVGVGGGTGTEDLCQQLAVAHPGVELVAGGGVREVADLERLQKIGVRGVLLASALHDARITREQLTEFAKHR